MIRIFPSCRCQKEILFQVIYGCLAVTALIGPGMSMGYSGVAIPLLSNNTSDDLNLTPTTSTWFASIVTISMPFGCLVSLITMRYGRRTALFVASIVCSLGWIMIATSYTINQLLIGRFVTGVASGMVATPGSVYIAEITTVRMATMLTPFTSFFISLGSMLVYFLALIIKEWRMVAIISILIPSISAIGIYFMLPESPRWYLSHGRKDEAKSSLMRLRGLVAENQSFAEEFAAMVSYSEMRYDNLPLKNLESLESPSKTKAQALGGNEMQPDLLRRRWTKVKSCWKTLMIPQVWKPLIIINVFFVAQQFCGLYVIISYSVDFLTNAGVEQDANLVSVVIGLLQMASVVLLILCGDKIGRRSIAIISGSGMSISFLTLGLHKHLFGDNFNNWLPLTCVLIFELTGSFGFLTLPWAMIGEIYPTKFVNYLGPITTCMCGFYNFISVQLYPTIVKYNAITMIYVYTFVSILATIFVILFLPETRGKSKTEIEKQF